MSYIATVAACLTARISPDLSFITARGSSHGANRYFPIELYCPDDSAITIDAWKNWHGNAVRDFSKDGLCIVKDGWVKLGRHSWEECINGIDCMTVTSHCDDPLDWYYAWFNMVDKIPKHIYYRLSQRSIFYPKLWKLLNKPKKISEMVVAMPVYPLGDSPRFTVPSLYLPATDILNAAFPARLSSFLQQQDIRSTMTNGIQRFHDVFVTKQQKNLMKAELMVEGKRWKAQGPYDEILFRWIDNSGFNP